MLLALLRRIAYENAMRITPDVNIGIAQRIFRIVMREFCNFLTSLLIHKQIIT